MRNLRRFDTVAELNAAITSSTIDMIGLAFENGKPVIRKKEVQPTPPGPDYSEPFYINVRGAVTLSAIPGLQMSTDKTTWTDTTETTLSSGKTYFRVASDQETPLEIPWVENGDSDYDIGGNINSLCKVDFENDTNCYSFNEYFMWKEKLKNAGNLILPATTLADNCYESMFMDCISLTTAPSILPATTLADSCYQNMFYNCTSLTTAPALPATTLANSCYYNMFQGCGSLTTAPALPATTLANSCYWSMFTHCISLTTAPSILPATTLADSCYYNMFQDCRSLTTAPALPATTLALGCYITMFYGCTSLTTAPELPATTLTEGCYDSMFNGCTNLNYIKCLATDITADSCTGNWVSGVSSTGTFVKNPSMSTATWGTGVNGIPSGWTVQDA